MTHGGSGGTREGSGEPHEGSGVFDRCCTCGQKSEKLFFSETPKNHVFRKKNFFHLFDETSARWDSENFGQKIEKSKNHYFFLKRPKIMFSDGDGDSENFR